MNLLTTYNYIIIDSDGVIVFTGSHISVGAGKFMSNFVFDFEFDVSKTYTFIFSSSELNNAIIENIIFNSSEDFYRLNIPKLIPTPEFHKSFSFNCKEMTRTYALTSGYLNIDPNIPSSSDYDACNSFVSRFAYSVLSREESFADNKYITQFKYNVCGDCLDDFYSFTDENYQIAAPMWNTPEISDFNYINSANVFNSDEIFISGLNLFQNEENILLSIKFNNKKFLNSVTLHESYFIHAPAKLKLQYIINNSLIETEEISFETLLSTQDTEGRHYYYHDTSNSITFNIESNADIEEIRLIALNIGNKTTTDNNYSSENPYFVFRNLELDEDECYYCYANYSAPHDDFADTNCGTAYCPCYCTFSLLPWVDEIASCTDEFVNVNKVCS